VKDLIPQLYRAAKAHKVPMTKLVTALVKTALAQVEHELGDLNHALIADDQTRRHRKHV